jgi:hypothetical protein
MTESMPELNGATSISSRNIVRFAVNVPIEVALQCIDGIRIEGRYGDRVKFMLTDDRTMYVAPVVGERIRQLDIQPGELFHLCKCQIKNGSRKTVQWAVERLGESETVLERDLRRSLAAAQTQGSPSQAANLDSSPNRVLRTWTIRFGPMERQWPQRREWLTRLLSGRSAVI